VKFDLLLFVALLIVCPEIRATSIVLLASKTQIGIAADHKAERTNGSSLPDVCKIMHHRDFSSPSLEPSVKVIPTILDIMRWTF